MAITPRMPKAGSELSEQQASTEMTFRLNHARQTVEFVQRQVTVLPQCMLQRCHVPAAHCQLLLLLAQASLWLRLCVTSGHKAQREMVDS